MPLDNTYSPPQNIPLRPLNKGMIRNLPPNGLPDGSFLRLQNYRVKEYGLKRRGGFTPFHKNGGNSEETTYNEDLLDIIYYWSNQSTPEMLLLGSSHLMLMNNDQTVTKVYANQTDPETSFSITSVGTYDLDTKTTEIIINLTEEEFNRVEVNFEFWLKDVSDGKNYFLGKINNVSFSSGSATLKIYSLEEPNPFPTTADSAIIREVFISTPKMFPHYIIVPPATYGNSGSVIIADQAGKGLYEYKDSSLDSFSIESSVDGNSGSTQYVDSGSVITYFEDRLWLGNTIEQGVFHTQRIRWSDPVNFNRFQPGNYIDLPYSSGPLIKLLPLGSLLVAYFTDAIYVGRPTNISGRPYLFERLETGNMGLINQRAIVSFNDAHYFVGSDDIYALSANSGLNPIGVPILEETLNYTKNYEADLENFIQVEHDPETETIVFLFPDVLDIGNDLNSLATKLWRFNYKTNAWSYDEVFFNDSNKVDPRYYFSGLMPARYFSGGKPWEEWIGSYSNPLGEDSPEAWLPGGTPAPTETFYEKGSWENLKDITVTSKLLYIPVFNVNSNKELILVESAVETDNLGDYDYNEDEITYLIWSIAESGDLDFGALDSKKTVTRLGLKIFDNQLNELKDYDKELLNRLAFTVFTSDKQGYRWKRPSVLTLRRNYNEGYASFRTTGSTFRFKIINSQEVPPFKISEISLRVVKRGLQVKN